MIFPGMAETGEDHWQEIVIRHLALPDWQRLYLNDEMDLVGPIAGPLLEVYGPTYPSNGHFMQPILEMASGGTVSPVSAGTNSSKSPPWRGWHSS